MIFDWRAIASGLCRLNESSRIHEWFIYTNCDIANKQIDYDCGVVGSSNVPLMPHPRANIHVTIGLKETDSSHSSLWSDKLTRERKMIQPIRTGVRGWWFCRWIPCGMWHLKLSFSKYRYQSMDHKQDDLMKQRCYDKIVLWIYESFINGKYCEDINQGRVY